MFKVICKLGALNGTNAVAEAMRKALSTNRTELKGLTL